MIENVLQTAFSHRGNPDSTEYSSSEATELPKDSSDDFKYRRDQQNDSTIVYSDT